MKDLMKRIWKPGFGLLLLAAPVWVACDDDDDKDNGLWGDANITQAATTRYPGAQITEIERTPQGYEIQMWVNGSEAEMYIDGNYQWLYTEFEDIAWASLPVAVTDAFTNAGNTFNPYEDDVDCIEYPNGNTTAEYYRIELDREPADIVLLYNPDGSTYQGNGAGTPSGGVVTPGDGLDNTVRQTITEAVNTRYPDAILTEIDREPNGYEAQLRINGAKADMHFDTNAQWLCTEFEDILWTSLPAAVTTAFTNAGNTFNAYEDDVDRIEYPNGDTVAEYYRIELDREPVDIILSYDPDGTPRT